MRIAIANDMPLAVEAIRRALAGLPDWQLAWVAEDGQAAVQHCLRDRPDVLLMDLLMPRMDGVAATRAIMANTPCTILIVTSDVGVQASKVFEAMGAGALDAVDTPTWQGSGSASALAPALLRKLEDLRRRLLAPAALRAPPRLAPALATPVGAARLVALGASAGGPAALATILAALPAQFPASIVLVQHLDAAFAPELAHWLGRQSAMPVRLARAGEPPQPGVVLLAGGPQHLRLCADGRLELDAAPEALPYRPSVDEFFLSAARHWRGALSAVLLTGMGRDGARGLLALREVGHETIAQDQASCAVFGMPAAAIELGAARAVLPLNEIAPALCRQVGMAGAAAKQGR
ncbi:chemotaxis-specific protein-glutamate methyltransferase CheB [Paucibacter soli]|uniref:chemotaxis-specific protein-glutamate methyltransferase CheB n=1 Tax=Paucibacter soli TaxID=3133433 RepID=UPI0030A61026